MSSRMRRSGSGGRRDPEVLGKAGFADHCRRIAANQYRLAGDDQLDVDTAVNRR